MNWKGRKGISVGMDCCDGMKSEILKKEEKR